MSESHFVTMDIKAALMPMMMPTRVMTNPDSPALSNLRNCDHIQAGVISPRGPRQAERARSSRIRRFLSAIDSCIQSMVVKSSYRLHNHKRLAL